MSKSTAASGAVYTGIEFERRARAAGVIREDSPDVSEQEMIDRIMSGDDVSAITGGGDITPWERVNGVRLTFRGVRFLPSEHDGGLGWFGVIDAIRTDTGEAIVTTCGGTMVCWRLLAWAERELFPIDGTITKSAEPTKGGYYPVNLTGIAE